MRKRAYRPEVPDCLEGRSLLSVVAGPSPNPAVISPQLLTKVTQQMQLGFQLFARDRVDATLRDDLYNVAVIIPFGRVDGLGVSINRIIDKMQQDLAAGVPRAIRLARNDVLAATRAEVLARVRAGDVIVR